MVRNRVNPPKHRCIFGTRAKHCIPATLFEIHFGNSKAVPLGTELLQSPLRLFAGLLSHDQQTLPRIKALSNVATKTM